ncbi:MAG: IS4 family transposase [Fusobacteriaceae bacterium]
MFLMDSTEIKLPIKCKDKYKGAQLQSTMKINLLLELLNFSIKNVSLNEGTKNEQNFSKYIYKHLSIDSLVLKDLGYFNFEDFKEIEDRNSFFISRLRAGTNFFSLNPSPSYSKNGKIIEKTKYIVTNAAKLGADLEVNQIREYSFFIGNEKMPVKIVLTKLPEEVVDKRTKVIQERERRNKKPSPIAREFLNISGYVTNLWGFSSSEIIELYKMRWQIELLFKIFKSDFKIDKIKNLKTERVEAHIYATLIRILLLLEITKSINDGYTEETSVRINLL